MGHYSLEVLDANDNVHVFFGLELVKVFDVNGNGRLKRLFQYLWYQISIAMVVSSFDACHLCRP